MSVSGYESETQKSAIYKTSTAHILPSPLNFCGFNVHSWSKKNTNFLIRPKVSAFLVGGLLGDVFTYYRECAWVEFDPGGNKITLNLMPCMRQT